MHGLQGPMGEYGLQNNVSPLTGSLESEYFAPAQQVMGLLSFRKLPLRCGSKTHVMLTCSLLSKTI